MCPTWPSFVHVPSKVVNWHVQPQGQKQNKKWTLTPGIPSTKEPIDIYMWHNITLSTQTGVSSFTDPSSLLELIKHEIGQEFDHMSLLVRNTCPINTILKRIHFSFVLNLGLCSFVLFAVI